MMFNYFMMYSLAYFCNIFFSIRMIIFQVTLTKVEGEPGTLH